MNTRGSVAIVLAGGKSSRMGTPKPWLRWGDEFLLQRIVRLVGEAVESAVVVAAKDSELPPLPDSVKILIDAIPDCGPLGGLVTGLEYLCAKAHFTPHPAKPSVSPTSPTRGEVEEGNGFLHLPPCGGGRPKGGWGVDQQPRMKSISTDLFESAILVACDLPLLQSQFIQSLHRGDCDAAVPRIDGRWHPLLAAYSPKCLTVAREQLAAGHYRMTDFLQRLKVRELGIAELPEIESLRTANTPEEWEELLRESRG